jgi:radical SAM protein with 4Fe4S-binding SPASM domain
MIFNNTDECIVKLKSEYNIVGIVNCDDYTPTSVDLYEKIKKLHLVEYNSQDRIIFLITKDYYENSVGLMLQSIQCMLNTIDISNFFSCLVTTNNNVESEYESILKNVSTDPVPLHIYQCTGPYQQLNHSGHTAFTKYQKFNDLSDNVTDRHKKLLFDSDNFCMIPWTSMMIYTDSKVLPCSASTNIVGNCSTNSLSDIWNSSKMKQLRKDMLDDKIIDTCSDCIFKEKLGIDSLRKSTNRQFAHHITKIDHTQDDGTLPKFELNFIDARFNNLCNLSCRICGPSNSTSWHQPAVMLGIIDQTTRTMLIAGKQQYDIYDQLIEHVDTVEKIYFAGGEPFMIDQFYQIVEELDRQGRHDVELVYNTNLTQSSLKGKSIFETWKNFKNISIGASLDGSNKRAEYLRPGTKWSDVIAFRQEMMSRRPDINFYVSATACILNLLHLPDFHQDWTEQGLIKPEDFNIQIVLDPEYLRADSAPKFLKEQAIARYTQHLEWLSTRDSLGRATFSFKSVLNFLNSDRDFDPNLFWATTNKLDSYYNHNLIDTFPELKELPK